MRTVAIGFALCLTLAACHGGSTGSIPPGSTHGASANGQGRSPQSIQTYYSAVKADSPLIYYRMNETSGTTALDTSGHNYDATYGFSVSLGAGSVVAGDAAPSFPGGTSSSAKVLTAPANSAFALTGAMTVEFWVKLPATISTDTILYTQSFQSGSFGYPAYIALSGGSSPFFTMQVHTNGGDIAAYATPVLNASNHVVMTWNGTTVTGYVNGVAFAGATGTGPITNYASPYTGFTLGGPIDAHTGFSGAIGEFALYSTALSAARVTAHYNAGIAAAPTPAPSGAYATAVVGDAPVAYYPLNEVSGLTASDGSGHAYSGSYGTRVVLAAGSAMTGQPAPLFPGGYTSTPKVMTSSSNAALALSGAMSAEVWVDVPSSLPGYTQYVFGQSYASGSVSAPASIQLTSTGNFTGTVHTNGGDITASRAAVLGTKNHVVLTWTGSALTIYVNSVATAGGTGTGPLTNFASPYAGFNAGGAGGQTGYGGSVGQVALYASALSATQVQNHYNAATGGTVVWQTGTGTTGQYSLPNTSDGQCAGVGPTITGNNASFTSLRNTSTTYSYNGRTFNGASTCYRNQINPVDPHTGTNFLLNPGTKYTFTFQTVVNLNGNYLYQGASDGGLAADIPAIVWQTHSYGGDGSPCDLLVLQNTYVAYVNGITKYGVIPDPGGGQPIWNFHTCDDGSDFTGNAYNSNDTLVQGQTDNWQIDITAQVQGQSGGSIVVQRNGSVVYNTTGHVCDNSTTQCFWNFGAYTFYYNSSEEPPGWNNAGITVQFNNMKLVQH